MSKITYKDLNALMRNIQDCEDYLTGKQSTKYVRDLADMAARNAVQQRMANMIDRLKDCGLNLVDDEA